MTDEASKALADKIESFQQSVVNGFRTVSLYHPSNEDAELIIAALRSQPGSLAREEVARIIEPWAWYQKDRGAVTAGITEHIKHSLIKADAILALTPSHEAGAQEPLAKLVQCQKCGAKAMTEDQIKYMVQRFLGWKLPEGFNPDDGISFESIAGKDGPYPFRRTPSGTNLFDATQAEAMVRYMLSGLPVASTDQVAVAAREEAERFYEKGEDTRFDRAAFVDGANFGARLAAPASQDATREAK